jgi:hypothetical protein
MGVPAEVDPPSLSRDQELAKDASGRIGLRSVASDAAKKRANDRLLALPATSEPNGAGV